MSDYRIDIPPDVASAIRHLPPDLKRSIREALRAIRSNPSIGTPLVRELAGLWKYRVRRYRIVFEIDGATRTVKLFAVGHRRNIYEDAADARRSTP